MSDDSYQVSLNTARDPPAPVLMWRGASITTQEDYSLSIRANPTDPPQLTVGHVDGHDLVIFDDEGAPVTLKEEEWSLVEVLPRGRDLYDRIKFATEAPKRKNKGNLSQQLALDDGWTMRMEEYWNDGLDEERQAEWDALPEESREGPRPTKREDPVVSGAYVGWSSYMNGPVFVRRVRTKGNTSNSRLQVGSASFEGNEFKTEPEGSVSGRQTILHHSMLVRGNLIPLKLWVNGDGTFSSLFSNGTQSLEQIRKESVETLKALYRGSHISPVVKYGPLSNDQVAFAARNLDKPINPAAEPGPRNPLWGGPTELLEELWKVALAFPNDLLTCEDILHGYFLWYDITMDSEMSQEASIAEVQRGTRRASTAWTVPTADVVECILGRPHYLRWHEELGLSEYEHFFRYIHRMFKTDRARPALSTNGFTLDVAKLKRLTMQITSKVPGLSPQSRLELLPHMIPGSKMPRMVHMEPYVYPSEAELAMTGLTSVYLKGLPSYSGHVTPKETTDKVTLCVPTRLATNSFIGSHKPLRGTQWSLPELLDVMKVRHSQDSAETLLLTAPFLTAGPVWQQNRASISEMFEPPGTRGPAPDLVNPDWSLFDYLSSSSRTTYLHKMKSFIEHLIAQGVTIPDHKSLIIDHCGMPVIAGGPPHDAPDVE
ncbi:hypothetical protein TrVGV298_010141 [Trichoderma virens]|nr:hypothetical protein TrVGV298_010141 [Trichoderma virens]